MHSKETIDVDILLVDIR